MLYQLKQPDAPIFKKIFNVYFFLVNETHIQEYCVYEIKEIKINKYSSAMTHHGVQ